MYRSLETLKSLIVKAASLVGASIEIVPGGSDSTTTTLVSSQTSDVVITLPDATTTLVGQDSLDTVETAINDHITDSVGAHAASAIEVSSIPGLTADNVQAALEEINEKTGTLPNGEFLKWRNAADTLDHSVLRLNNTDTTQLFGPAGVVVQSNNNNGGDSGPVIIRSGDAALHDTGDITIASGPGATGSGTVRIETGDASAASAGNIIIEPGASGSGPDPFVHVIASDLLLSGPVGKEFTMTMYASNNEGTSFTTNPSATLTQYTLPPADGDPGQVLSTDGSGNLSWEDGGGGVPGVLPNDQALQWEDTGSGLVDVLKLDSIDEVILSNSAGGVTINPSFPEASVFIVPGPPDIGNTTNSGSVVAYTESLDDTAPDSMATGAISATTGDAFGATSGNISLFTGNALSTAETGISGDILIQTGAADDASGEITIRTGSSTNGQSGSVTVELGDSGNGNPAKLLVSNGALEVQGPIGAEALITLAGSSGYTASFESPPDQSDDYVLTLPKDTGSSGQVLSTDGSGLLSWENPGGLPTGSRIGYVGTTAPTGWVRANGRTIGSAASAATERANADTEALYTLLWNSFTNTVLPVSGGRGASASADFLANKTIALPDFRGRTAIGNDAMGNTAAGRVTSAVSGFDPTVNGASGGSQSHTLTAAEMPSHTHGTGNGSWPQFMLMGGGASWFTGGGGTGGLLSGPTATGSAGSGGAHRNMQPSWVETVIIKL